MNIVHCISSIDNSTGGPARSSTLLVEKLLEIGKVDKVTLLTLKSANPLLENFESNKGIVSFHKNNFGGLSIDLNKAMMKLTDADIFHGHGIWDFPIHQMSCAARNNKIPYILSIRGMLEPWSLEQSKIKKRIAMSLYQHKDLRNANCLHATALSEAISIRKLGYLNPIAIIPNGVDVTQYRIEDSISHKEGKRKILFLSRIHYKKGIEILINAWERLDNILRSKWEIDIVGDGDPEYINYLQNIINKKSLQMEIRIIGPKYGKDKLRVYQEAELFVLPTHSENFGMVVAESLACGVPVITTKGTPWSDLITFNAGEWIDIGVEPLVYSFKRLLIKDFEELRKMGRNGRHLIEQKYSISAVADKFFSLYNWIINKTEKPDFITYE